MTKTTSFASYATKTRFAMLGIPGFHRLWRNFPDPSARLANFLPCDWNWQSSLPKRNARNSSGSVLVVCSVTTP